MIVGHARSRLDGPTALRPISMERSSAVGIRKFLTGVVAFIVLIWGPVSPLALRVAMLVGLPTAAWFLLGWMWRVWRPDDAAEDRLFRTLAGFFAAVLCVGAVLEARRDFHFECTEGMPTRDGFECVGDYERAPGPDLGSALMLAMASAFAFSLGMRRPVENQKGSDQP